MHTLHAAVSAGMQHIVSLFEITQRYLQAVSLLALHQLLEHH